MCIHTQTHTRTQTRTRGYLQEQSPLSLVSGPLSYLVIALLIALSPSYMAEIQTAVHTFARPHSRRAKRAKKKKRKKKNIEFARCESIRACMDL